MSRWREDPDGYKARADTFAAIMRLKQNQRGKEWDDEFIGKLRALLDEYEALGGIVERYEEETRFALNSPSLWVLGEKVIQAA